MFIVQARPETIYSSKNYNVYQEFSLNKTGKLLLSGVAVGKKIASGRVNVIKDAKKFWILRKGILVTEMTDPDWNRL